MEKGRPDRHLASGLPYYAPKSRAEVLAEPFELPEVPGSGCRYNIAPTQPVAAVRAVD